MVLNINRFEDKIEINDFEAPNELDQQMNVLLEGMDHVARVNVEDQEVEEEIGWDIHPNYEEPEEPEEKHNNPITIIVLTTVVVLTIRWFM